MTAAQATTTAHPVSRARTPGPAWVENVALVDLLDRLLAGGVVVAGEITLSIAGVDLVRISLRALVASVRAAMEPAERRAP
jgi:hypothetical protein